MSLAAVQETFGLGDQVDRVWLAVDSNEARDAVRKAVTARLPEGFVVQAPVNQMQLADDVLRTTELALRFAGALSMAMAAFVVLNTLRMNFGERRRDMAVLRVLGVTSRQMVGLHLVEGLALGLVGSVAGIPLGFVLGRGLGVVMQSMLADAEVPAPPIPYWTLPAAIIVGPLVASIAALLPALQSRNISPVEAMGDFETRRSDRLPLWATLAGLAMWSLAVGVLVLVVLERLVARGGDSGGRVDDRGLHRGHPRAVGPAGARAGPAAGTDRADRERFRGRAAARTAYAHRVDRGRAGGGH